MHSHSIGVLDSCGSARSDGSSQCDGVYWDGSAWRVCLSDYLPWRDDGSRTLTRAPLEPIETAFHGGEEGCRTALAQWLESRS